MSNDEIKASVYKKENELLAIIAITDKSFDAEFTVRSDYSVIKNALTNETLSENGEATLKLSQFDYLILNFSKK